MLYTSAHHVSRQNTMCRPARNKQRCARNGRGSHIVEFAAGISILVGLLVLPLLNLAILPVRWMMAQELVNDYSRRLALSETYSQAFQRLEADPSLKTRLGRVGGVAVNSMALQMRVSRVEQSAEEAVFSGPNRIGSAWLPDGDKAPCSYSLELAVDAAISPAITLSGLGVSVPGLTRPIALTIHARHPWGNLGQDPATGQFYLNE